MKNNATRVSILNAVSDWLKLLALIVLVGESLLGIAYHYSDRTDPVRAYYFPLMVGLLTLIVVGLFVDRVLTSSVSHAKSSGQGGKPKQINLVTRWYFKSGVTEEDLHLTVVGHGVTGKRTTRHPRGKETVYDVTGWHHTSTYWLEYHDALDQFGGGALLLDEFTNDRLSGMVLSKDCATGVLQCRTNLWVPPSKKRSHNERYFRFVGKVAPADFEEPVPPAVPI